MCGCGKKATASPEQVRRTVSAESSTPVEQPKPPAETKSS